MSCFNLGNFSISSDVDTVCYSALTTTLYGNDLLAGTIIYSDASCTLPNTNSIFSDGFQIYTTDGFGVLNDPSGCTCTQFYCINNTGIYDDEYSTAGFYGGYLYYTGQNGYYIYFSVGQDRWCLSSSLGGSCDLFGSTPCNSSCPDLCDSFFTSGYCSTTTTTTSSFCDIDFVDLFTCNIPVTPTPTGTATPTPTPTQTPTPTNPCGSFGFDVEVTSLTPTPTPTPTLTPTPSKQILRPCNYVGKVTFNTIDDYLECPVSKQFRDCFTGELYYTGNLTKLTNGSNPREGYVYDGVVNDKDVCVIFDGLNQNVSGIDNIELYTELGLESEGACLSCAPTPIPTSTQIPTTTTTTTVCYECLSTLTLPQIGSSVLLNSVTASAIGSGAVDLNLSPSTLNPCIFGPDPVIGSLRLGFGTNTTNPYDYRLNFDVPVNNIALRIIDYQYFSQSQQEVLTFTVSDGDLSINSCVGCCAKILNNTITAEPCFSDLRPGAGIFTFTSTQPFQYIIIQGLGVSAITVDICADSIE
jgi:hypothetical protein